MINKNTIILEHIFRNPQIEDFIKEAYKSRYEKGVLNDEDLIKISENDYFIYNNYYDIKGLKEGIKKDTEKAVVDLGERIDEVLAYVFPRDKNEPENFTRGFNLRCGPKGQYRKEEISYPVKSGDEMANVICMPIEDFLIYSKKAYLLGKDNIFFNPHGSYKPKKHTKNVYGIGKIHIRIKTPESLADKVIRYLTEPEKEGEKIVDLIGIRIILDENSSEDDCYRLNKALRKDIFKNKGYKIIEITDYISEPKESTGFQSLRIAYRNDSCFEVQIRTKEMHDRAMRDQYNIIKFQNGKNDPFFLLLSNLFSARYL